MRIEDPGPLGNADGLDGDGRARSFYETFIRFRKGNCIVRVVDDGGFVYDAPFGRLDLKRLESQLGKSRKNTYFIRIKHNLNEFVLVFDTPGVSFFCDIPFSFVLWR